MYRNQVSLHEVVLAFIIGTMKLTRMTHLTSGSRIHKRSLKGTTAYKKLLFNHHKNSIALKKESERQNSSCENSNDSGVGIDIGTEQQVNNTANSHPFLFRYNGSQKRLLEDSLSGNNIKRYRTDDCNDGYNPPILPNASFPILGVGCVSPVTTTHSTVNNINKATRRSLIPSKRMFGTMSLSSQFSSVSSNGKVQLQIINQPEAQHRARYQTEGSRGAIKDKTGNSFPVVKICGFNRPTTVQVFIGNDQGRVAPHMFYQACRVTGKNSTPCVEKNIDGTVVIEIETSASKNMTVTCDCVGILKERNVDVEHRFPEHSTTRSKKKSTKCRMVFRTAIINSDGNTEILQISSQPIACTQPPGVPEISKKSLTKCSVSGGKELFIIGKNFSKDSQVLFQTSDWQQSVYPDKEFLQQTHIVCTVPTYKKLDVKSPVATKVCVTSGNRTSESHMFTYLPIPSRHDKKMMEGIQSSTNESPVSDANGMDNEDDTSVETSTTMMDLHEKVHGALIRSNYNLPPSSGCSSSLIQSDSQMMPPPSSLLLRPTTHSMLISEERVSPSDSVKSETTDSSTIIPSLSSGSSEQLTNFEPQFSTISESSSVIQNYSQRYRPITGDQTTLSFDQLQSSKVESLPKITSCPSNNSFVVSQTNNVVDTEPTDLTQLLRIKSHMNNILSTTNNDLCVQSEESCSNVSVTGDYISNNSSGSGVIVSNSSADMLSSCSILPGMMQTQVPSTCVLSPSVNTFTIDNSSCALASSSKNSKAHENDLNHMNMINNSTYGLPRRSKSFSFHKVGEIKTQPLFLENFKDNVKYKCMQSGPSIHQYHARVPLCMPHNNCVASTDQLVNSYQNFVSNDVSCLTQSNCAENYIPKLENASYSIYPTTAGNGYNQSALITMGSDRNLYNESNNATSMQLTTSGQENNYAQDNNYNCILPDGSNSSASNVIRINSFVPSQLDRNDVANAKLQQLVDPVTENHISNNNASLNTLNNNNDVSTSIGGHYQQSSNMMVDHNNVVSLPSCLTTSNKQSHSLQMNNHISGQNSNNTPLGVGTRKPEEVGVFTSEISRMSDHDLLRYINPSCFDQV